MAHLRRHNLDEAKVAAEKSVSTSPKPAVPMLILGLVFGEMGDLQRATALFEQALKLEPELVQGRLYLAGSYRVQGRTREACEVLRVLRQSAAKQPEQVRDALAACPSD
jgi:Flp pilus assembly protein TadD